MSGMTVDDYCAVVPFLSQEELVKFFAFLWYVKEHTRLFKDLGLEFYMHLSAVHDTLSECFLVGDNYEKHFELIDLWCVYKNDVSNYKR